MRRLFRFARRILLEKKLYGGKKTFTADRVRRAGAIKRVALQDGSPIACKGYHGAAYDLFVYKGKHKVNLVIKKYHNTSKQSEIAQKEFDIFQRFKAKGFSVPPTIRLVRIHGRKYVALTDLSKLGKFQTKELDSDYFKTMGIPEEETKRVADYVRSENQRAKEELGMNIIDGWEFIIDTKNKIIKPFILDLGWTSS
jgi:hypothetical protein